MVFKSAKIPMAVVGLIILFFMSMLAMDLLFDTTTFADSADIMNDLDLDEDKVFAIGGLLILLFLGAGISMLITIIGDEIR